MGQTKKESETERVLIFYGIVKYEPKQIFLVRDLDEIYRYD